MAHFPVYFVVSNNLPGSVQWIVADTASHFVRQGVPTTVLYPALPWWDHKRFILGINRGIPRLKEALRLGRETAFAALVPKPWCGLRYPGLDPRIRSERFFAVPSAAGWEEGVAVVHPPYVLPHLIRTLRSSRVKLVSAIHVDLEKALTHPDPQTVAWFSHWIAMERCHQVPRYATSAASHAACERLGIRVDRMIPGGIDLSLFSPNGSSGRREPVVLLYCDPNPQKGRDLGVRALREVRQQMGSSVRLHSIGRVNEEQSRLFDRNHGYQAGRAYARALQESDIFVYPSLYDGFPAPPLQAMACGLAVVTTRVAGLEEYARDQVNCLLVRPGHPASLRDSVLKLVRDEALRKRLVLGGRSSAQAYSTQESSRKLLQFLEELYGS